MAVMTYDDIVKGLRDSNRELQIEGRTVRAGLKLEQDTAAILDRYRWLYSDAALEAATAALKGAVGEEAEARKRVRAAIIQGIIERRTAAQQDELTTFYATATVEVEGKRIPFFSAQSLIARDPDPDRRELLGDLTSEVMDGADDLALEVNRITLQVLRELGHDSYTRFWAGLKEVDYKSLAQELGRVADAAQDRYRAWVEPRMRAAGRSWGDCPSHHASYFRGLAEHDGAFRQETFEPAMRSTFDALGLELFSAPTITIDIEDRPAKNPRASVWVPDAGREVHLLTRPRGGNHDYAAFLHEAGHALHYGLSDPELGWPLTNLGRSMAYAELWSYLFERIGHYPAWIAGATGVGDAEADRIAADLTGVDLMMFTRYVGKLSYELELYSGDALDSARGRRLFAGVMGARTGFRYDPRMWQFDRDGGYYSADYLRAWLAEAALEERLRERFGAEWWASRQAGEWLRRQWRRGSLPEAEETVAEEGGRPWSGEALDRVFSGRLPEPNASR